MLRSLIPALTKGSKGHLRPVSLDGHLIDRAMHELPGLTVRRAFLIQCWLNILVSAPSSQARPSATNTAAPASEYRQSRYRVPSRKRLFHVYHRLWLLV